MQKTPNQPLNGFTKFNIKKANNIILFQNSVLKLFLSWVLYSILTLFFTSATEKLPKSLQCSRTEMINIHEGE